MSGARWRAAVTLAGLGLLAAAPGRAQEASFAERYTALAANREHLPAAERLHALLDLQWERKMVWYPEEATWVGWDGADHGAWTDQSPEAIALRREHAGDALSVLDALPTDSLSEADRLNYDLFRRNVESEVEGNQFPSHLLAITQLGGVQQDAAGLLEMMPARSVEDFEAILSRLRGLPRLIDQTIGLLDEGLERGVTPPRVPLRDVPEQVANQIVDDPLDSSLLTAFRQFPETVPASDRERLLAEARVAYTQGVAPAFGRLHDFLGERYLPGAREAIAATALPDGEAWYAFEVRQQTTTDLEPDSIHALGLSEVARIRGEMDEVIEATGFEGDFAEFLEFLRTDPQFFYDDPEALLTGYRDIAKRADPELSRLFGRLPRLPYGIKPVPAYAARSQPTAYYQDGSPEVGRPGWFFANTYALDTRPKWEMEAVTLHEAVPGHHFQTALAQELEGLPEFRRLGGYTAFGEGWGLYSESLGEEMGFYEDPYSKFGQLTYEMWRAVRLVVDTGMHAKGWSRQQAIDYFIANSSKSEHDIIVEIDRYIVWPGQALAYKIGELKIKELRGLAARELGAAFDVREFHDVVLGQGALPLEVLERIVREWIAERKRSPAAR
ncbi:MAG: DUF885 domain-containing protein [Gemmatimonadota bacterium]